jgi:hypothetical protein
MGVEMFVLDLLFVLVITVLLTVLFGLLFRGMRMGLGLYLFFLVLFLATWAGGLWITPFGPTLFEVSWLPFLLVGLFFTLLLIVLVPPARTPQTFEEARVQASAETEAVIIIDIFFWVLMIGLLIAIAAAYV